MRNIFKPAGAPAQRRTRGLAAILASVALTAGLGAYPAVQAQETHESPAPATVPEGDIVTGDDGLPAYNWMDNEKPTSNVDASVSAPAAPPATPTPAATLPRVNAPAATNPVTVERKGDVDHITVNDPEGEAWEFGGKASKENIFALKREGKGEIKEVLSVTADGRKLEAYDYGFLNSEESSFVAFDLQALHTIPPMVVEIEVRTTDASEYVIAESDEVPTAHELASSGYGLTDQESGVMDPAVTDMSRAAVLPASKVRLQLGALSYVPISGTVPPRGTISTQIGGERTQQNIYLTEVILTSNSRNANNASLAGPITISKNGGTEKCTVPQSAVKTLNSRSTSRGEIVDKISVDLTGCKPQIVVWEGDGNRISVTFTGPGTGNVSRDYSMELYGALSKSQSITIGQGDPTTPKNYRPIPNERGYDTCNYSNGLLVTRTWWDNTPAGGMKFKVAEIETGLPDLRDQIDVHDPRFGLSIGHDQHGWTKLEYGTDYTLSIDGGSLYFVLNKEQQRKPRTQEGYDLEARIPLAKASNNCRLVMWDQDAPGWLDREAPALQLDVPETPREKLDWLPASAQNPQLPNDVCIAKNIALVFDTSDSIGHNNGVEASRLAGREVIKALQGTDSNLAIYNFASDARSIPDMSTGKLRTNNEEDIKKLNDAVDAIARPFTRNGRGGTNYEAGLAQIPTGEFDVVYFITDGLPTTSSRDYPGHGFDIGTLINQSDLSLAVKEANRLKDGGTRIETVMVGFEPFNEHILKDDYFGRPNVSKQPENWPKQQGYGYPSHYASGGSVREGLDGGGSILMWDTPYQENATQYDITNQPEIWRAGVRNTRSMGADISSDDAVTTLTSFDQLARVLRQLVAEGCYSVSLEKVDHENAAQLLQDYRFELLENGAEGEPFFTFTENTPRANNLITGRTYQLVERKAPAGYSLLTQPLRFSAVGDGSGKLELQVDGGIEQHPELEVELANDSLHVTFKVANIRQGDLPKTGGAGLQLPLLLSGAIIAAGVLVGRRKAAA